MRYFVKCKKCHKENRVDRRELNEFKLLENRGLEKRKVCENCFVEFQYRQQSIFAKPMKMIMVLIFLLIILCAVLIGFKLEEYFRIGYNVWNFILYSLEVFSILVITIVVGLIYKFRVKRFNELIKVP